MKSEGSRQVVDSWVKSMVHNDLDAQAELCTQDVIHDYPQSGERIRGWGNVRAIAENYPGGLPQDVNLETTGSEDKWVLTPSFSLLRIEGTGDVYTVLGTARYPDGVTWHAMALVELRAGKIAKVTWVVGAPFDPPAWRKQWVERLT